MHWQNKVLIQRVLDRLPGGQAVYGAGQQLLGGMRSLKIDTKVDQGLRMFEPFQTLKLSLKGQSSVEVGTGWVPVVPMLLWLAGNGECFTYDLTRLLIPRYVQEAARQLVTMCDGTALTLNSRTLPIRSERYDTLVRLVRDRSTAEDILEALSIRYSAPSDAGATPHLDNSVDLVFSNTVMEHVPVSQLVRLFRESFRILKPGGWALHLIDPSDHFSHSDSSISKINFLRFSDSEFDRYNTRFCYQNRLRAPEYAELLRSAGFEISVFSCSVDDKSLGALASIPLSDRFKRYTPDEVCSTCVSVGVRKPLN
jgi:SAM-dependent methyltransferase